MKIICTVLFLTLSYNLMAQTKDTIQLINFFGTYAASIDNEIKTYRHLKPLMKAYPETYTAWKKARNAERLGQLLLAIDAIGICVLLVSDNEAIMLASLVAGVGTLTTFILYEDVRNHKLKEAVQLYNQKIREERINQLSPH
ncbi:MAG: hypothetical protein ACK45I_03605 [Bacteroidota bacterium]